MFRAFLLPILSLATTAAFAEPESVFIENLTWPEVRDAIDNGKTTAIYFAGSTEQNGPHMALGKHNFIARYVAGRIAEELGNALVYPILPFAPTGDTARRTGHMRFPGSINITNATFTAVARDVAQSAIAAGFSNVVLMGEHGDGQKALGKVAKALDHQWGNKGVHVYYIPDVYYKTQDQVRAKLAERGIAMGRHAGIYDTSELLYLDSQQQWIRKDKLASGKKANGVDGDPKQASAELGKLFLDIKVSAAVAQIKSVLK